MAHKSDFTLNNLKWNLRNPTGTKEQSLLSTLDGFVKAIDNSEILEVRGANVSNNHHPRMEVMPMSRSFQFPRPEDTPNDCLLLAMKQILEAEQELADQMLVLAKSTAIKNREEAANQRFRKLALMRVAIRQRFTEWTDARFRILGYVLTTTAPVFTAASSFGSGQYEAQNAGLPYMARERKLKRRQMLGLLEEVLGVSKGLSGLDQGCLMVALDVAPESLKRYLRLRFEREHVAFVGANLPKKHTLRTFEARMQRKMQRYIRPKEPMPFWWPLPLKQVARNKWGTSKM